MFWKQYDMYALGKISKQYMKTGKAMVNDNLYLRGTSLNVHSVCGGRKHV